MKGDDIRIELIDGLDNKSYLVRNAGQQDFVFMSSNETPLALSNVAPEAALCRFALRDAKDGAAALAVVHKYCKYVRTMRLL